MTVARLGRVAGITGIRSSSRLAALWTGEEAAEQGRLAPTKVGRRSGDDDCATISVSTDGAESGESASAITMPSCRSDTGSTGICRSFSSMDADADAGLSSPEAPASRGASVAGAGDSEASWDCMVGVNFVLRRMGGLMLRELN